MWIAALVVFVSLGRLAGSSYVNSFSLPGTSSAQAVALLQSVSPRVTGRLAAGSSAGIDEWASLW